MITAKLIRSFSPCYDPKEVGMTSTERLTPLEFINAYGDKVKEKADTLWLLCRKEFMTDRDMRLFAVWCAREAVKLSPDDVDPRSIAAIDTAESFALGTATQEELEAAWSAARSAAWSAARSAQIEQLKTYFK